MGQDGERDFRRGLKGLLATSASTRPRRLAIVFGALGAIFVVRHVGEQAASGVVALVLLPVLWLAGRGSRFELACGVAGVAAGFVIPILIVGPPRYPAAGSQTALFVTGVVAVAGALVHHLVRQVHREVEEVERRRRDLEALLELTRDVSRASDARAAVCDAARALCAGRPCLLIEPDGQSRRVVTAAASAPRLEGHTVDDPDELIAQALMQDDALVDETPGARFDSEVLTGLGRPEAVTVQPVASDGLRAVLLVAGDATPQLHALGVLAAEAATVITRADVVAQLERLARIDPLTGLLNRRAWDERLLSEIGDAARGGTPLTIVLVDLDGFKRFNDAHGHQAGDRALKEAASTWLAVLRDGDVLARWGGDEFAVLLRARRAVAEEVVERLRTGVVNITFSAGISEWNGSDDSDDFVARADTDLYANKQRRSAAEP